MERCTFDELWYMDAGVTTLDDDNARWLLCEALTVCRDKALISSGCESRPATGSLRPEAPGAVEGGNDFG